MAVPVQYSHANNYGTGWTVQSSFALSSIMIKSYYIAGPMFKQSPQFAVMLAGTGWGEEGIKTMHLIWVSSWLLHPIYSDLLIVKILCFRRFGFKSQLCCRCHCVTLRKSTWPLFLSSVKQQQHFCPPSLGQQERKYSNYLCRQLQSCWETKIERERNSSYIILPQ